MLKETKQEEWIAIFPDREDRMYRHYYDTIAFCEYKFLPGSLTPHADQAYYQVYRVVHEGGKKMVYYRRVK